MKLPFETTPEQRRRLAIIVSTLYIEKDIEVCLLDKIYEIAFRDQGAFDLLSLLFSSTNVEESKAILKDIEDIIKDHEQPEVVERPSFDDVYVSFAKLLSKRSTCDRLKVGCVVVTEDNHRVLSIGYNGGAKGLFNRCLSDEPGKCGHVHAEANALVKCNFNDPSQKKLYVTHMPCFSCSVLIVNSGISEVIYCEDYRLKDGVELLESAGVKVRRYLGNP